MKVLNVMLSEEAQSRIVADGQDVLSYSQNVPLRLTEYMKDVRDVVEENHMYIRIASNDFFAVSKDVVPKRSQASTRHSRLIVRSMPGFLPKKRLTMTRSC